MKRSIVLATLAIVLATSLAYALPGVPYPYYARGDATVPGSNEAVAVCQFEMAVTPGTYVYMSGIVQAAPARSSAWIDVNTWNKSLDYSKTAGRLGMDYVYAVPTDVTSIVVTLYVSQEGRKSGIARNCSLVAFPITLMKEGP